QVSEDALRRDPVAAVLAEVLLPPGARGRRTLQRVALAFQIVQQPPLQGDRRAEPRESAVVLEPGPGDPVARRRLPELDERRLRRRAVEEGQRDQAERRGDPRESPLPGRMALVR